MESIFELLDIPVVFLSNKLGSEVTGTRLFITLLYVYPITWLQNSLLRGKPAVLHQLSHILFSAFLLFYNFKWLSLHFLVNTLVIYILISVQLPRKQMVILSFVINMVYLCSDYLAKWIEGTEEYTIRWSTPHCVLTLKLIGVTWDIYDSLDTKTGDGEDVKRLEPSLLELLGFAYFPPGLMTGPQISFSSYCKLTAGLLPTELSSRLRYAASRLSIGLILMVVYPLFSGYISSSYLLTTEFDNMNFLLKMLYVTVWGQVSLAKYVGVWLIAEGSCILSRIAYNGTDEQNNLKWDGSANVKLITFIAATQSQHFIDGFNVNTNKWVLKYSYKRLRFLNNRNVSQIASLMFLAVWHGFSSGYFMCFVLEFIVMAAEGQVAALFSVRPLSILLEIPATRYLCRLFTKFSSTFTLGYALVGFELHSYSRYMQVYSSLWYVGHIVMISICLLSAIFPPPRQPVKSKPDNAPHAKQQ